MTPAAAVAIRATIQSAKQNTFLSKDVAAECAQVRDSIEALLGSVTLAVGAWGEPDQGLRLAMRPEKAEWAAGETPRLLADISNGTDRPLNRANAQAFWEPALLELQVDGRWYYRPGSKIVQPSLDRLPYVLSPDGAISYRAITLDDAWVAKDGGKKLALTPGQHIVRLAHICKSVDPKVPDARPVSRPVAIEILSASAEASASAKATADKPADKPAAADPAAAAKQGVGP